MGMRRWTQQTSFWPRSDRGKTRRQPMKYKLLLVLLLAWTPSAFAQSSSGCPNGSTRVYTKWISQGNPSESGCVPTKTLSAFLSNGSCPSGFWHTAVANPPHNDVCVREMVAGTDFRAETPSPNDAATQAPVSDSPPETHTTELLFANNERLTDALKTELGKACGLPIDEAFSPSDAEAIVLKSTVAKLDEGRRSLLSTVPVIIVPASGNLVNAWTISNIGSTHAALICLPTAMRQITKDAPEELAAVLAHEMGHAIDRECWNIASRSPAGKRSCEARADSFGFAITLRAGYNPFAFAGMFGRLEMYSGDTETGFLSRLANVISGNHPITPDRIEHLRQMLTDQIQGKFIQPGNRIEVPLAVQ